MDRPSFQFYPGDWRQNAKLRRCTRAARSAWVDFMCMVHDEEEYGVVRLPLSAIASSIGECPMKLLIELRDKNVLKGCDEGAFPGYTYSPRHAGRVGPPEVIVAPCNGPIWFSSRMVRDEYVRMKKARSGGKIAENDPTTPPLWLSPKPPPMVPPMPPPKGGVVPRAPAHASAAPARSPLPLPLPTHPNPMGNTTPVMGGAGGELKSDGGAGRAGFPSPESLRRDAAALQAKGEDGEVIPSMLLKTLGARFSSKAFSRADITTTRVLDEYERAFSDPAVKNPVSILGNRLQLTIARAKTRRSASPPPPSG